MQCLNCNTPMKVMHYKEVEFDRCPQCEAHWFDMGELQTIFQHMGSLFNEKDLVEGVTLPNRCRWCETQNDDHATECVCCDEPLAHQCPRDHHVMYHTRFGPVEIDICPGCRGLWFDGDEFRVLVQATQAAPAPRAGAAVASAQAVRRRPAEADLSARAEPSPARVSGAGLPTAASVPGMRGASEGGLATSAGLTSGQQGAGAVSSQSMFGAPAGAVATSAAPASPRPAARSAPSGPCQICGKSPQGGGPLQWEHGFWKCPPCFGPEDPNEADRLNRLRARNERVWRSRIRRERVVSQLTDEAGNAFDILPNWLGMLGSWLKERSADEEGER